MPKASKKVVDALLEDECFELANFFPQSTGLPYVIWISDNTVSKHNRPRCKVRVDGQLYPLSIDEPVQWLVAVPKRVSSKDFAKLAVFIRANRDAILAHWRLEIDSAELARRLRKLPLQDHHENI